MILLGLVGVVVLLTLLVLLYGHVGFLIGVCLVGFTGLLITRFLENFRKQNDSSQLLTSSLEDNSAYFKEFLDRLPLPVFIKDAKSSTVYVNSCFESMLGSGWIGKSVHTFFPKAVADHMIQDDRTALVSGTIHVAESFPVPDGSGRLFQTIKFPLYQNGQPMFLAGLSIDISQQACVETTLETVNAHLNILNAELECRNRHTQLLLNFNHALQGCSLVADLKTVVSLFMPQLLPQYAGLVAVSQPQHESLKVLATWELPVETPKLEAVPCNNCWSWRCRTSPWIEQANPGDICTFWHGDKSVYYTCVPIYGPKSAASNESSPITGIVHFHQPNGMPIPDMALQLAESTLVAINQMLIKLNLQQSLHEQSIRDPLTNLFNRRYLDETLSRELSQACRQNSPVSLIVLDIDHFKQVNDTFGHAAGDLVLQQLGQLLRSQTRHSDIACRYGGEEFVIVLPNATLENSYRRAEEIRLTFAGLTISYLSTSIQATLSLGIAAYPIHGTSAEAVFRAADAALYLAKSKGRNQTLISPGIQELSQTFSQHS